MAIQRTSRSGLFLLELMIVILFFAVTSAICMNLFVQAHLTSTAGSNLTAAVREVQSVAELFKASDGDLMQLAQQLGIQPADGPVLNVYYDKDWVPAGEEDAVYTVTVLLDGQTMSLSDANQITAELKNRKGCQGALVIAWTGEEEIFRIPVKKYVG